MERSILGWLLIGLVAGVLGKLIMPGRDPGALLLRFLSALRARFLRGSLPNRCTSRWWVAGRTMRPRLAARLLSWLCTVSLLCGVIDNLFISGW